MTNSANAQMLAFIENTPKNTEFAFAANKTGFHEADGTVSFNEKGLTTCYFRTIEEFAQNYFQGADVPIKCSHYCGSRDDDGEITLHEGFEHTPMRDIDSDDDSSDVYTLPRYETSFSRKDEDHILEADAFELLDFILKNPTCLQDTQMLGLIQERNDKLASWN
jgi:hypothetical protein